MTLYGIGDPARAAERTPTFTFTLPGITPREICEQLAERGILGWDGNYYALGTMLASASRAAAARPASASSATRPRKRSSARWSRSTRSPAAEPPAEAPGYALRPRMWRNW